MKRNIIILILLCLCTFVFAQKTHVEKEYIKLEIQHNILSAICDVQHLSIEVENENIRLLRAQINNDNEIIRLMRKRFPELEIFEIPNEENYFENHFERNVQF